jgi:hypothetical protein
MSDFTQLLKLLADAIIDSVRAAGPLGAPGGVLYAALMTHGLTFNSSRPLCRV